MSCILSSSAIQMVLKEECQKRKDGFETVLFLWRDACSATSWLNLNHMAHWLASYTHAHTHTFEHTFSSCCPPTHTNPQQYINSLTRSLSDTHTLLKLYPWWLLIDVMIFVFFKIMIFSVSYTWIYPSPVDIIRFKAKDYLWAFHTVMTNISLYRWGYFQM